MRDLTLPTPLRRKQVVPTEPPLARLLAAVDAVVEAVAMIVRVIPWPCAVTIPDPEPVDHAAALTMDDLERRWQEGDEALRSNAADRSFRATPDLADVIDLRDRRHG